MTAPNDGGPAFPCPASCVEDPRANRYMITEGSDGLSLRDYFAAQAMAALLRITVPADSQPGEVIACAAYMAADAMLAERAKAVR